MQLPLIRHIAASRPLARTPHRCSVCGLSIAIGSRYARHVIRDIDAKWHREQLKTIKWHLPSCPQGELDV